MSGRSAKTKDIAKAKAHAAAKKAEQDKRTMRNNLIIVVVFVLVIGLCVGYGAGVYLPCITAVSGGSGSMDAVMFNYFYRDCYDSFQSAYGEMLTAYGTLDENKGLDEQDYSADLTWAEFFLQTAVSNAERNMVIHDAAEAQGIALSEAELADIDSRMEDLKAGAKRNGYMFPGKFLRDHYGKGATLKSYREYLEYEALATELSTTYYADVAYTDEELTAWFSENYPDAGTDYDYNTVNFRLIYFPFSGYEYDESTGVYGYSEDAKNTARNQLQAVLNSWNASDMTEETFGGLASSYSSYKSEENGLYENAVKDDDGLEAKVVNWVFADDRTYGDTGTIEAESGDYMLYWVGEDIPAWQYLAQDGLRTEAWNDWYEALAAETEFTVNDNILNHLNQAV